MSNIVPVSNPTDTPATQGAVELPIKSGDDFIAEAETMDLSSIKDNIFMVAISTGDRNKVLLLSSTIHGPYNFPEMVEQVGSMWKQHLHHAKVIILEKDVTKGVKMLGQNTVDYIEAHYGDIIVEEMLSGTFDDKEYTCQADTVQVDPGLDPRNKAQIEAKKEEDPEEEL